MGAFDETAPDVTIENITDEDIEAYIKYTVKPDTQECEPALIREALSTLNFTNTVSDASEKITTH